MKLFPNLERISIKEHAKSDNYEDYIGVVLDKDKNVFKVVEGQFADKKDMYRQMKARGLILRKAYERKVWEWIEANSDGVIISYLMLSTAFSKWRSNNVLHKYYEKLLHDIPELNREREKGNPNTRGGDLVPEEQKKESVGLEEDFEDNMETHVIKLVGVPYNSDEETPIISAHTNDKGEFRLKSPYWFTVNGQFRNPTVVHIVDELMNTNNSNTITGLDTKNKYKEVKVYVDGELQRVYDPSKIGSDVREIDSGRVNFEKSAASNIISQADDKIKEIIQKLSDENISDKQKSSLRNELRMLSMQKQQAGAEKHVEVNNLRGTPQAKIATALGRDDEQLHKTLSDDTTFNNLMTNLSSNPDTKALYDQFIQTNLDKDDGFGALNKSYSLSDFTPLSGEQISQMYSKIVNGAPVAETKKERKNLLHNLIWYVLADGRMAKESEKQSSENRLGITRANRVSDLLRAKQAVSVGGFNHKTQSGDRNGDVEVGDLEKIRAELRSLGVDEPTSEPKQNTVKVKPGQATPMGSAEFSKPYQNPVHNKDNVNLAKDELSSVINDKEVLDRAELLSFRNKRNEFDNDAVKTRAFYNQNPEAYKADVLANVKQAQSDLQNENGEKNESVEISQPDNWGATTLHNAIPYQGKGFDYSAGPLKMTGQIVEDTTHTELNPKLFENDILIPEVRDALYKIAMVFKDSLDLPFEIKDVYFTGSNANYNYGENSDIDLHLVYDFEQAGANAELLSKYLVAAKKDFNDKYDIKVKGLPVELGCENISTPLVSTGVYSLGANTWVIKPENAGIEIPDVDMNAFNDLSTQIDDTVKLQNATALHNLMKTLKDLRKDSLAKDGEFGQGNLLYKKLRNDEKLEKLRKSMYNAKSKELSLESSENLEEGELSDKKSYSEYLKDLQDELNSQETQDLLTSPSLLKYLDGYSDKNEKRKVNVSSDGALNEDIPNWKLSSMEKQLSNGIPPQALKLVFTDSEGKLCRFSYKPETKTEPEHLYKIPVKREEVLDGVYRFISHSEDAKEISLDDFWEIIDSPVNQKKHAKTSVNAGMGIQKDLIQKQRDTQKVAFDKWYDEHNESLGLDEIETENNKERNRIFREMYRYSKMGFSDEDIKDYFSELYQDKITEDADDKLYVNKDTNEIRDILIALNPHKEDPTFLAKYVTRPIYQKLKKRDPSTFKWENVEKQWQITSMDNVTKYLKDGQFDLNAMPYNKINVNLVNTAPDANRDSMTVNMVELSNLISSCEENDINYSSPKLDADIHNSKRAYRQQMSKTYTRRRLTDKEIEAAKDYVKSDEFKQKVMSNIEEITNAMKGLNKEENKELYGQYSRMLKEEKFKLMLSNARGNVDLITILNAVEDGVHIEHGRDGYYIKLPEEGFTYEDVKNRGAYQPDDVVKRISTMG